MCLAIPAKILNIEENEALVDFGGTKRKIRLDLVDAKLGDWVIVHTGYAIEVLDDDAAKETLKFWQEYLSKVEQTR